MNIGSTAAVAAALKQSQIASSIQMAVAKQAFEATAQSGQALLDAAQEIQSTAQPGLGQFVDKTV